MEKRMDETMDAEKFLKELIHRALLGSREAQQECTDKGIAIPCPLCGEKDSVEILDCYTADGLECESESFRKDSFKCICNYLKGGCGASTGVSETKQEALEKWNTRLVPPIGRCKDCVWSREPTKEDYKELDRDLLSYKDSLVCDFWEREVWGKDFCSYFDKREGQTWK